jgi:hypothetical protein
MTSPLTTPEALEAVMRETFRSIYHDNMALRNAAGLLPMEP